MDEYRQQLKQDRSIKSFVVRIAFPPYTVIYCGMGFADIRDSPDSNRQGHQNMDEDQGASVNSSWAMP